MARLIHDPSPGAGGGAVAAASPFAPQDRRNCGAPAEIKVSWTVQGQSAAKPSNDFFGTGTQAVWWRNEDRYRYADRGEAMLAAVSDGAGSSGIYCGAWAEALVECLPETPITGLDALNRWMGGFWEEFSGEFKRRAAADPGKHSKFVREGSFATLVACWLRKHGDGISLNWLGYGDSPLYVFDEDGGGGAALTACYPPTLAALEHDPHLLNWKDLPREAHLKAGAMELTGRATVILASDGIGQFVLLRYLADLHARGAECPAMGPREPTHGLLNEFRSLVRTGNGRLAEAARAHLDAPESGFADELAALRAGLRSQPAFQEMIRDHHQEGLLPNDDATLVMIDTETRLVDEAGMDVNPEDAPFP